MIDLSNGGAFDEFKLLEYIRQSDRNYIIQGQKNCLFQDHTKLQSLDYWLRPFGTSPDVKQADNDVMAALVATSLFVESRNLPCPETGRPCKGLVISE